MSGDGPPGGHGEDEGSGEEVLVSTEFSSTYPWKDADADCVVICCSDHRFRSQSIDLIRQLGYKHPHVISLPSSVAIAHGMVAADNFLSEAFERLLAKAVELTGVSEVICIAHEDCGGYKAGRVELIGKLSRRLANKSVEDIQREHLLAASRGILHSLSGVNVRTFYAELVEENGEARVRFRELPLEQGRTTSRRRRA